MENKERATKLRESTQFLPKENSTSESFPTMRNFMVNRLHNQKQRHIKEVKGRNSSYQYKREPKTKANNFMELTNCNLAIDTTLQKQRMASNFNSTQEY